MDSTHVNSLFAKIGKVDKLAKDYDSTITGTIPTNFNNVGTIYEVVDGALGNDRDLITGLPTLQNTIQSTSVTLNGALGTLIQATIVKKVNQQDPQPNTRFNTSLASLIASMQVNGQSVKRNVVSETLSTDTSNYGNGAIAMSLNHPFGYPQEYLFNETLNLTCTADAVTGYRTAENEIFTVTGSYQIYPENDARFPKVGSQANAQITVCSPWWTTGNAVINGTFNAINADTSSGSIFTTWSELNTPQGAWVSKDAVNTYDGSDYSASFGINSGNPTYLYQNLILSPSTQYSLNFKQKRINGNYAVGVSIVDRTTGLHMADNSGGGLDGGTPGYVSNVPSSTGLWVNTSYIFRTPTVLPTQPALVFTNSTMTDSSKLCVAHCGISPMTSLYMGGPQVAIHSGNSNFRFGDNSSIVITNNNQGQIQTYANRLLGLRNLGYQLPSADSGSETISDGLIG
jgi:hypothetical protein